MGDIPLMLRSTACVLEDIDEETGEKKSLILNNEDENDPGGYFIINGLEKILRNIIIPRKNFIMGVIRSTFNNRRNDFT